jgi:NADH:ubiquinone oxidoreductase subunit 3 (subunit A)
VLALGGVLVLVLGVVSATLVIRWVGDVGRQPIDEQGQLVPFTGGHLPATHAWSRYHVRYYPMAILFLAFDMEMVFMYPWAVVFLREGMTALVEMLMFIVILLLGVLYAWKEGGLSWQ